MLLCSFQEQVGVLNVIIHGIKPYCFHNLENIFQCTLGGVTMLNRMEFCRLIDCIS